jgi:predicted Zn-dependent protease
MILLGLSGREAEAKAALDGLAPKLPPAKALVCEAWLLARGGRWPRRPSGCGSKLDDPDVAQAWADAMLRQGKSEGIFEALEPHALDAARWIRLAETARANSPARRGGRPLPQGPPDRPENAALLNNFAYVSLQLNAYDAEEVRAAARKAFALAPKNVSMIHTYATALLRTGKERECIALLQKER